MRHFLAGAYRLLAPSPLPYAAMRQQLFSSAVSDERTRQTIKAVWDQHRLLPNPMSPWRGAGLKTGWNLKA